MRKQRQNNDNLTIEFLEKKYQEEKQILMKENRRLKHNLEEEIERGDLLKIKCEQLQRETQSLNAEIVELKNDLEDKSNNREGLEQVQLEIMKQYQSITKQYNSLLAEKGQLVSLIQHIYNEKGGLEKELNEFRHNETQLHQQIELIAQKHAQYKNQSLRKIEELSSMNRSLEEELEKSNCKMIEQKRKGKQVEKRLIQLEKRLRESEQMEDDRFKKMQEQMIQEKNALYESTVQFNTKYKLLESKCSQIEKRAEQLEKQLKQAQRRTESEKDIAYQLKGKLEKQQAMIHELEEEVDKLQQENKNLESQKNTVPRQDFMRQMRKNLTDMNQLSQKNLIKMSEGATIRQYPSQSQFGVFIKQDDGLERAKLEGQINALETQIMTYKKQLQTINDQLRRTKRQTDQKQHEIERRETEIRDLKHKLQKQGERGRQILALRKQNQNLRGKQTDMIERAKEIAQYETSVSLKLAFYERKIKQNLDSLDRKQSIIQKHKTTLVQLEDRQKHYEQALKKLSDQVESLRGYKQQSIRKETLLKDYKNKNEKLKDEKEDLSKDLTKSKADIIKLRNDKQRFQTQLEIRQKQLSSLKSKYEKVSAEKNDQYYKQNNRLKENKNVTDHKIKQLRKQKQELSDALQQIKSIIINKVEQYVARRIPSSKKKTHEYEAAKLLGLKAGDLQEFLNPDSSINRRITVQLEDLWLDGNFVDFVNNFINYISTQMQKKQNEA